MNRNFTDEDAYMTLKYMKLYLISSVWKVKVLSRWVKMEKLKLNVCEDVE